VNRRYLSHLLFLLLPLLYNHPQGKLNKALIKLLLYSKPRRKRPKGRKKGISRINGGVSIEQRPRHVEDRQEVGHWEGDLMIGVKQSSAIGTLVERKTRFTYITKLSDRKSETVTKAFEEHLNLMNPLFKKTLTYDNGLEMANHKWLTEKTGIDVYFAHPYSSWERGTNENTNGLIRRDLPKGTNFNDISLEQLKLIQEKLNNRPRKVIGYRTPNEMVQLELSASIGNNPQKLFPSSARLNTFFNQKS
jgi:IS30 family transposase